MIRPIVTSPIMLRMPSAPATPDDASVGRDLLDTLAAHSHECVGMAANMIGVQRRVIVVMDGTRTLLMYNPEILDGTGPYETEEGCLSLTGVRACRRFRSIRVRYLDEGWHERTRRFSGYTAQIIQHEVDHTNGIVI